MPADSISYLTKYLKGRVLMLKSLVTILTVVLLFTAAMMGTAILSSSVSAEEDPSAGTFSAGDTIIQGGLIVGCKCPKLRGPCVCQFAAN